MVRRKRVCIHYRDREGTVIAHPDTTFVLERANIKNLNIVEKALKNSDGTHRFYFQEEKYIGCVAIVKSTGWPVIVIQSVKETFTQVRRVRSIFLLGISASLIMAIIFSQLSIRRIIYPLSQLVKNARKIADGDYNVSVQAESYLEIDELFRDFTRMADAIKDREEELLNVKKLESIGILAGGIAHDFNNILTVILGNIELAKMFASRNDKMLERLEHAEKAALRAKDLTQQLLTFSRGGAPVKHLTSIAELLKETASFALSGSNVSCEFDIADHLYQGEVDEGQMSQVINNLIINADQSMPGGG